MSKPPMPLRPMPDPLAGQKVIQIKEPSPPLPSSVGTDTFHATFFGAPALQPSKAESDRKGLSCFGLAIVFLFLGPLLLGIVAGILSLFR